MIKLLKFPISLTCLMIFTILIFEANFAYAYDDSQYAILQRILPVGKVNIEQKSQTPDPTKLAASATQDKVADGEKIYTAHCQICHAAGIGGAPKLTDATEWNNRSKQGINVLVTHAIKGYKAMPPKGGCVTCSDADIKAAVEYMLKQTRNKTPQE